MKLLISFLLLVLLTTTYLPAQSVHWKPKKKTPASVELFHSTQSVHFATTTFLHKGEWEYEISHRFLPTITTQKSFAGLDGPAHMRMGLAYGLTANTTLMVARSNFRDNVDLQLKQRLYRLPSKPIPLHIALRIGLGWNTDVFNRTLTDRRNFQYYAQLIFNTLINKKWGIGLVPSYLYNSHIDCPTTQYSFTLGFYSQYYLNSLWSLLVESNTTLSGYRGTFNSLVIGIELETGGHFFKIFVGNNAALNPSQYLAGSDLAPSLANLRLGFNITRILKF